MMNIKSEPENNASYNIKFFPESNILANNLNEMFPEQKYEDKIFKRVKEILGDTYTNEDVQSMITSFNYLINGWMEEYERKVFNNKTLKELLQNL